MHSAYARTLGRLLTHITVWQPPAIKNPSGPPAKTRRERHLFINGKRVRLP